MHIAAFIVIALAIIAGAVEWYRTRSLLAAALTLFALAFALVHTLEGGDRVTFG